RRGRAGALVACRLSFVVCRLSEEVPMAGAIGTPAWEALAAHQRELGDRHLRDLFAADPSRGERLGAEAGDLYLDYSKHRITDDTVRMLLELVEAAGLRERIDAMWSGVHINVTEDRPVLHVALRM